MYTPILRNRQNEMLALKLLSSEIKSCCFPLVDMASPSLTKISHQDSILKNLKHVASSLVGFKKVLIDSSELNAKFRLKNNEHPLQSLAKAVESAQCIPVPVTGPHRDEAHWQATLKISHNSNNDLIGIRLDSTDIATASLSLKQLLKIYSSYSIQSKNVILILDLQSVYKAEIDILVKNTLKFINIFKEQEWAGFILAGYGIPDHLTEEIKVRDEGYIPRNEKEVFIKVAHVAQIENLWFGDFTTLSPMHVELDFDFKLMYKSMGPKVIYTLDDSWFIARGGPFSNHDRGYKQYYDLAKQIISLEDFYGEDYSFGDNYIFERSKDGPTTGNPASWIKACVNHHITLTANQFDK